MFEKPQGPLRGPSSLAEGDSILLKSIDIEPVVIQAAISLIPSTNELRHPADLIPSIASDIEMNAVSPEVKVTLAFKRPLRPAGARRHLADARSRRCAEPLVEDTPWKQSAAAQLNLESTVRPGPGPKKCTALPAISPVMPDSAKDKSYFLD